MVAHVWTLRLEGLLSSRQMNPRPTSLHLGLILRKAEARGPQLPCPCSPACSEGTVLGESSSVPIVLLLENQKRWGVYVSRAAAV